MRSSFQPGSSRHDVSIAPTDWKGWLFRKISLDWLFWGLAFLFLAWVNSLFLFHIPSASIDELRWIFLFALLHAALFISVLMLIGSLVEGLRWNCIRGIFDGLCFVALLALFIDYLLFRVLSIHLWTAIRGYSQGGFHQILLTLDVSGIRPRAVFLFTVALVVIPMVGALVRLCTRRVGARAPCLIRPVQLIGFICLATMAMAAEGAYASSLAGVNAWLKSQQVMPLSPHFVRFPRGRSYPIRLRPLSPGGEKTMVLTETGFPEPQKPDVFLFILESVRPDYLDELTAPNLARFSAENRAFDGSISCANATHLSWFSIFNARLPFYYRTFKDQTNYWGSLPLKVFRRLGYAIHFFSAARLDYCHLDELILGPGRALADSCYEPPSGAEADRLLNGKALERLRVDPGKGGRLFVIAYDSTHHDYKWPGDFPAEFKPYVPSWNYLRVSDNDLPGIHNRYRNSIHFVDHQFGKIISHLKKLGLYDRSLVAVTSDHGEEFREFGNMVHASALNHIQTGAPLIFHFPSGDRSLPWPTDNRVVSHIDLLPTLLDYLGTPTEVLEQFDGQSILHKRHQYALSAAQNFQQDPYQFYVHNGRYKAFFRFSQEKIQPGANDQIYLTSVTDAMDRPISVPDGVDTIGLFVEREFGQGLPCFFELPAPARRVVVGAP